MSQSRLCPPRRCALGTLAAVAGSIAFAAALVSPAAAEHYGAEQPGAVACEQLYTTPCLVALTPPVGEPRVVTRVHGAFESADFWIVSPRPGTEVSLRAAGGDGVSFRRWEDHGPYSGSFATRFRLEAGERLAVNDPSVVPGGPTTGYMPVPDSWAGAPVELPLTPSGIVWLEPDTDGDGWGDETQDLCPGVAGPRCMPGAAVSASLTAPEYVPSRHDTRATWTAKNDGESVQPLLLDVIVGSRDPQITGPAGMRCAPRRGDALRPIDAIVPPIARNPLAPTDGRAEGWLLRANMPVRDAAAVVCILPPLRPGEEAHGEIHSYSGTEPGNVSTIRHELEVRSFFGAGRAAAGAITKHFAPNRPIARLKPGPLRAGRIDGRARLKVRTTCTAPALAPGCTLRAVVKARVGRRTLAKSAPVTVPAGTQASLTARFSKTGKAWLRKHPRAQVTIEVTASRIGETDVKRALSLRPKRSAAGRR